MSYIFTCSASAKDKRSLKSGQAQPHFRPWNAEMQERPSEDHRRRLGLHRPGIIIIFNCVSGSEPLNSYIFCIFLIIFNAKQY